MVLCKIATSETDKSRADKAKLRSSREAELEEGNYKHN